jgi:hypothetical protein
MKPASVLPERDRSGKKCLSIGRGLGAIEKPAIKQGWRSAEVKPALAFPSVIPTQAGIQLVCHRLDGCGYHLPEHR